jgi:ABC-2 type transport system permease protein
MRGLYTVFEKELADYFISWRGIILFAVVLMATVIAIYGPSGSLANIRASLATPTQFGVNEFVFLNLFTTSGQGGTPSFLSFITMFLVPILGITLGFDAINGEKNSGTLSRLLSQPIYRDTVFNGKFLAGIVTIAIMLTSIVLLVSGLGLRLIGVPPSSEEAGRIFLFLIMATLYGAFWLSLSMLFSVFLQRVATSALASIAIWIFFLFFALMISGFIANTMVPINENSTADEIIRNYSIQINAGRVSPVFLFQEATTVLLVPGARTMSESLQILNMSGANYQPGALPLGQTLIIIWPHIVAFVAIAAVCFGVSYYKFTREEIRST